MNKSRIVNRANKADEEFHYLSSNVGMMARDLDRAFRRAIDARVARFGLAAHTCRYLAIMRDRGATTPKEFSEILDVRSPTVLSVLRTLEANRLIRHTRDASDARKSPYELTPLGAEIEATVRASATEVEEMALRSLTASQIAQFTDLVRLIHRSLVQNLAAPSAEVVERADRTGAARRRAAKRPARS